MANYFIPPPILDNPIDLKVGQGYKTYSESHYTKASPIESYIKTRHFEAALRLTKGYFHRCNVIDFGCADGPFLPSLAKYFERVVGIDQDKNQIELSRRLCDQLGIGNVELICVSHEQISKIKDRLGSRKYKVLFLLETLEHIGGQDGLYESKINFLKQAFSLLDNKGLIVVSVPVMIGLPFLLQRMGLGLLGKYLEPLSIGSLLKAGLFCDTKELEENWEGRHLGFNHCYLEGMLRKRGFEVVQYRKFRRWQGNNSTLPGKKFLVGKIDLFFQKVYVFRQS